MAKKSTFFVINGRKYKPIELDFNAICDMEDNGISLGDVRSKPQSTARAYLALYYNGNTDVAGNEIQQHIIGGGTLDGLFDAFRESVEDSGFFQAINKATAETSSESEEQGEETKSE